MAEQKYVSSPKSIKWDKQIVYQRLSNWEFLSTFFNPENMKRAEEQIGEKAKDIRIENFKSDRDSCQFDIPKLGYMAMHIIERDEPKTIKIVSDDGTLLKFTLWIQILPTNSNSCKMRLTLHTELNMMMKMMIGKKLENGINQIADGLARIPYGSI